MSLRKGNADKVVQAIKSRIGKNKYTQGPNRNKVGEGYGDCSATVRWSYLKIGVDVGGFTGDQIKKGVCVDKGPAAGGRLNINNLKPGDLLFYKGRAKPSTFRPYGVGHVEMYIGNGKTCGHGSGTGPTTKNIKTYRTKDYIMAKRYVENTSETPVVKVDTEIAVTPYMFDCVGRLTRENIIDSPDFWKNKLLNRITVGEAFAIIKKVHHKFKPKSVVNYIDDYKLNSLIYLFDNEIISDLDRWKANIDKAFPVWTLAVILMNMKKQIAPRYTEVTNSNFKNEAILFLNKNDMVNSPEIWLKKIDEPMLVWEVFAFINNFYDVNKIYLPYHI